jgi:hypothetical protein
MTQPSATQPGGAVPPRTDTVTTGAGASDRAGAAASALSVFLSASVPDELAGAAGAQRVYDLLASVVRALFAVGAELVFGGHPTITPLVHRLAREHAGAPPRIALYQLERFRTDAPPETHDEAVFGPVHWVGNPAAEMADDLAALRVPMVERARAAVFIAGKTAGFRGARPGIREEYERFRARHPAAPVYLMGGAGGETARIIADAEADGADWELNGLDPPARELLHRADDPALVAALIGRDLPGHMGGRGV